MRKVVHLTTDGSRGQFTFCRMNKTPWGTPENPHRWTSSKSDVTCKRCIRAMKKRTQQIAESSAAQNSMTLDKK